MQFLSLQLPGPWMEKPSFYQSQTLWGCSAQVQAQESQQPEEK